MGDGEVHLGDVGDAGAHGLGELLAQVPGLLADQREGVTGLEGGTLTVRPVRRSTSMLRLSKPISSCSRGMRLCR